MAGFKLEVTDSGIIVIPTIITNVLYHKIISLKEGKEYNYHLQALYSALFYTGVAIYLPILFLSDWIISIAFPIEYAGASEILMVYSTVLIMVFFQSLNNKLLILHNLQHLIMYRVLASLLLNFVLNLYLIPKYGLIGAAYATVLSEASIIFSYWLTQPTKDIFWFQLNALNPFNNPLFIRLIKE